MPAPAPIAAHPALAGASRTTDYRVLERELRAAGWSDCGAGDWAFALVSPQDDLVARISPFDPVGPYTARLYEDAAPTGRVPRLHLHRRLAGGADLQVMDRLFPVDPATARDFLSRFAQPTTELTPLAEVVRRVHAEAQAGLAWCGPLDTNPSNIMRTADGDLVLADPYYAAGPQLYALAGQDPDRFVTTVPAAERHHLTEIPLTESGPWPAEARAAMAAALRTADDRRAAQLIRDAATTDVDGWGFAVLDGRATEERPPWRYGRLLAEAVAAARVAVDLDTGGGEVLAECPRLASAQHVTESWPPNAARARELLGPRGVQVHETAPGGPIPLADATADLVTSRHPVSPDWAEIVRVLAPGGEYLGQHVGPGSAFALIEHFVGPTTEAQRRSRHPDDEAAAAEAAGLEVTELRTARLRMEFFDVGAVVWILRRCVWWVPDFDVERYRERLMAMDAIIRRDGAFVAHSTRHLLRARKR